MMPTNAFADTYKIMAFGDSLTAGYNLDQGDGFAEQLQKKFNEKENKIKIINAGVSGDTTSGGLARLNWALADQPDLVILELGANDALRGIDPKITYDNLAKMIEILKNKQIKVLLTGMLAPPNYGEAFAKDFNSIYPRLAKTYSIDLYPFFLKDVAGVPDLNLADGIHPTKEGISIIVDNIFPYIEKVMN